MNRRSGFHRGLGWVWVLLAAAVASAPQRGAGQTPPDSTAAVEGTVYGVLDGDRRVLPFAVVQARGAGFRRSASTDRDGRYRLSGLPGGRIRISVTQTGHLPLELEVIVPPRTTMTVDLELTAAPVRLSPVDVVRDANPIPEPDDRDVAPASDPEMELQALEATPGVGSPGLLDAVRSLPGNDPARATDVLYMRGATTDLKLVLLDGAPVYTPFHVAGLLRSFEPAVLGRAELHVGGAPARFDGGLTHILDIETRRPRRDRLRGSGAVDLLSASSALEGPLGSNAGFLVSARTLHDLGSTPLGGDGPYGYRDVLGSAEWTPSPDQRLRVGGFWNREAVRLDFPSLPDDAHWSNGAGSMSYLTPIGAARLRLEGAASRYRATLPLQPTGDPKEPPPPALVANASSDRLRFLAEAAWGPAGADTRVGFSHDRIDASYDARVMTGGPASGSRTRSTGVGIYFDATRPLTDGVTLRAGLRADAFSSGGLRMAPRAALNWEVGPDALLSVAAGRYHQATRTPDVEVERTLAEVVEEDLPSDELLPVATADHVVVSLDQTLGGRVRLGLAGFWKGYEGLETAPRETVRSSGIDLRLRSSGEAGTVWIGYGLSWFWSTRNFSGYASDFAGRHLLSAGGSGAVAGPLRGEIRVAYGAGLPYTAIPFRSSFDQEVAAPSDDGSGDFESLSQDSPLVGGLDEDFLRIDVELHATLRPEWGGRQWTVRPYIRLLNALDRRDALFYTFQPWRSDSLTPLAERPLLPVLGVAFAF